MADKTEPTELKTPEEEASFWGTHRLVLLLAMTILIAFGFTAISLFLYNNSGAAQLDLSRPGYRSVSDKVDRTDEINTYSASGAVNKDTINEFIKLYDSQALKAKAVDAFSGDPLNPDTLEFGTPSNE